MRRTHHSLGKSWHTWRFNCCHFLVVHRMHYYTIYFCITRTFVCELIKLTIVTKNVNVNYNVLMKLKRAQSQYFKPGQHCLILSEHLLHQWTGGDQEARRRQDNEARHLRVCEAGSKWITLTSSFLLKHFLYVSYIETVGQVSSCVDCRWACVYSQKKSHSLCERVN